MWRNRAEKMTTAAAEKTVHTCARGERDPFKNNRRLNYLFLTFF